MSGVNYYFEPVESAFKHGLRDFAEALGSAISFLFMSIPWLLIVLPFLWIIFKVLKVVKVKISASKFFNKTDDH